MNAGEATVKTFSSKKGRLIATNHRFQCLHQRQQLQKPGQSNRGVEEHVLAKQKKAITRLPEDFLPMICKVLALSFSKISDVPWNLDFPMV
jgi:hypothetical protein